MAAERSLFSGSTAMLLLGLLEEKDRYGYEMIETLEQRSNHLFELKAGTLYPLLHSLEAKAAFEAAEAGVEGVCGGSRKCVKPGGVRWEKKNI